MMIIIIMTATRMASISSTTIAAAAAGSVDARVNQIINTSTYKIIFDAILELTGDVFEVEDGSRDELEKDAVKILTVN